MEDLHVHEVQQGMKVSKESSSATLGAMLPQVPPDKTIIKKKEGIDDMIPEELMEFIYNEDATYTYAVEGAISNMAHNVKDKFSNSAHAKDVKAATLPFKVRQLTIERATLRAKISWMSKRKSKQEKVLKYKKRLVEVEQALRRIQNTVNSAAEKKQIEAQIKELDSQVTKSVSSDLEQRGVLEAVNEFIREGKETGTLPDFVTEFTRDELFERFDDEVVTESGNVSMLKTALKLKSVSKKNYKRAKKAIKKEEYADAAKYIGEIKDAIKAMEKEFKEYPVDSVSSNLIGGVMGITMTALKLILRITCSHLITAGALTVSPAQIKKDVVDKVDFVTTEVTAIVTLIEMMQRVYAKDGMRQREDKGNVDMTQINGVYKRALNDINRAYNLVDNLTKKLKKAHSESSKKAKDTESAIKFVEVDVKESVKLAVQAFETDYITESEFLDLIIEAKKPDDGMMPILSKLHNKGYKTKYSCAGHKDSGSKDRNDDGIVNGKLASAARIMFNGDYDFPDPPKHWGFKTVDGKDYLYVLQFSNDGKNPNAFDEWKNKYMASLERWVDSLPSAKEDKGEVIDAPKDDAKDKEKDVKESVDFDSMINNEMAMLMMDLSDNF